MTMLSWSTMVNSQEPQIKFLIKENKTYHNLSVSHRHFQTILGKKVAVEGVKYQGMTMLTWSDHGQ